MNGSQGDKELLEVISISDFFPQVRKIKKSGKLWGGGRRS